MTVLARYLCRLCLGRAIGAVLAFAALVQVLDLIEVMTDILDRGVGLNGVVYYALLRLPTIVAEVFPLGVLVGALAAFAGLARGNEILVMRATGVSSFRIAAYVLPVACILAGLHFFIADRVAPGTERTLSLWWSETKPAKKDGDKADPKWLNLRSHIVAVDKIHDEGSRLEGVRIYDRGRNDLVTKRTIADEALYRDGRWHLRGVTETAAVGDHVISKTLEGDAWDVKLEPADVVDVLTPTGRVSAWTALAILRGERAGSRAPSFYRTLLHRSAAEPASVILMLLLAMPAAFMLRRHGNAAGLLLGLGLGLTFLIVEGVATTFGETGLLAAPIAAWAPLLLFASISIALLMEARAA